MSVIPIKRAKMGEGECVIRLQEVIDIWNALCLRLSECEWRGCRGIIFKLIYKVEKEENHKK